MIMNIGSMHSSTYLEDAQFFMKKILVLQGPNLNMLGSREPSIYGNMTLKDIHAYTIKHAMKYGIKVICKQSNHEGELITLLQNAAASVDAVIFNPGGYSHTSVALYDTIRAITIPVLEVHISNVHAREHFRKEFILTPACVGQICGLGWLGYGMAVDYFAYLWNMAT